MIDKNLIIHDYSEIVIEKKKLLKKSRILRKGPFCPTLQILSDISI